MKTESPSGRPAKRSPVNRGSGADRDRLIAAALAAGQGHNQYAIGELLGIAQPSVHRLLKTALSSGLLRERSSFTACLDDAEIERATSILYGVRLPALLAKLAERGTIPRAPKVFTFFSGNYCGNTRRIPWDRHLARFSSAMAAELQGLVGKARFVGVGWGVTIHAVITALEAQRGGQSRRQAVVFPLCGEPLGARSVELSASTLAGRLSRLVGASGAAPSMLGIPAALPVELGADRVHAIWQFLDRSTAIKRIFGERAARERGPQSGTLIAKADMIVTSLSQSNRPWHMYGHDEIRELLGVTQQDLERSFLGDIGGVLLPRKDGAVAADGVVKGIETHWVGMRYAELQAAATRAAARKAPGVVVLAIGANKVDVLASAIRRGLVNHVFIDQDLARATEQVLQRLLPQPARGESIGELVDGHARQE